MVAGFTASSSRKNTSQLVVHQVADAVVSSMLRWARALLVWQQQHLQPACCAATAAAIFCASTCFAAVALQAYIDQKSASSGHTAARVDALLFAPPNVGNRQFVRAFNARVNARKVQFAYDLVPQVPCAPSMAACPDVPVPTHNPDGSGIWQYSSIGGGMLFSPASMPHQASSWERFGQIHPCKLAHFIMATHTCSYACWLSSFVRDASNSCLLLREAAAGGEGTYCAGSFASFPDAQEPPYPYKA